MQGLSRLSAEAAADEIFFPFVLELIREVFYKAEGSRDTARVVRAIEGIGGGYDRLERELEGREHLCGAFTVADIGWFLSTGFATNLGGAPRGSHRSVAGWLARVGSRASVRREQEGLAAAVGRLASAA